MAAPSPLVPSLHLAQPMSGTRKKKPNAVSYAEVESDVDMDDEERQHAKASNEARKEGGQTSGELLGSLPGEWMRTACCLGSERSAASNSQLTTWRALLTPPSPSLPPSRRQTQDEEGSKVAQEVSRFSESARPEAARSSGGVPPHAARHPLRSAFSVFSGRLAS